MIIEIIVIVVYTPFDVSSSRLTLALSYENSGFTFLPVLARKGN